MSSQNFKIPEPVFAIRQPDYICIKQCAHQFLIDEIYILLIGLRVIILVSKYGVRIYQQQQALLPNKKVKVNSIIN